ncbi:SRPBCC family protein [Streptomyces sp. NPDC001922]|uniref:type II toxin-antitoxin system Rv0910 family toxin n=1 Tax=Streptomyces sp. NPDC001922 TaxID=3364624 RepID=UPI0036CAB635
MAEVSAESHVEATADEVWARLTDFTAYGRWNATHTAFPAGPPTTLEPGTSYAEQMKLMGFPADVTWTVAACEAPRLLHTTGKGPMGVDLAMRYLLAPDGTGTRMRIEGTFSGAAVSLMAGRLRESATAALTESLRRLGALATSP